MKKEILTLDMIKYDYKKQFISSVRILLVMPIILMFLLALIIYLFSCLTNLSFLYKTLIISSIIFFILLCLAVLRDSYVKYCQVKNGSFRITTDKLISYEEKIRAHIGSAASTLSSRPYILNFASYGKYYVPEGKNYQSSNIFNMNDDDVFNRSIIGDTFFLIINQKEEVLLAYNAKLFEYKN